MCVMEMSHRSKVFQQIIDEAEQDLRDLMNIPDNYKVLFIQGGGTLEFAMVPMNLMKNGKACYVETGTWSKKAIAEAKKYGDVTVSPPPPTRTIPTSPTAPISTSRTMPTMSTSVKMRRSTARRGTSCRTRRGMSSSPTSPPCSSPVPAMSPITV